MPFKIITGNFMKQEAEIMVIPTERSRPAPLTAVCKRVYNAAGYDEMTKAREGFGELEFGDIVVTSGFDLNAHNVIHVCVPSALINIDAVGYQKAIRKGILKALKWAEERDAESISFAPFGTGTCRELAQKAADAAIRTHLRTEDSCMKVYLVVPPSEEPVYEGQEEQAARESTVPENYTDCYSEYSMRFEEMFRESGLLRDAFCRQYVENLLTLRITNAEQLARTIDYDKGDMHRFRSGQTLKPRKHRVIAIAVAMGLSDEERYNFIRCVGYKYPDDDRDRVVEKLIRSGVRDFDSLNNELCKLNPDYALNAKSKNHNLRESSYEK